MVKSSRFQVWTPTPNRKKKNGNPCWLSSKIQDPLSLQVYAWIRGGAPSLCDIQWGCWVVRDGEEACLTGQKMFGTIPVWDGSMIHASGFLTMIWYYWYYRYITVHIHTENLTFLTVIWCFRPSFLPSKNRLLQIRRPKFDGPGMTMTHKSTWISKLWFQ